MSDGPPGHDPSDHGPSEHEDDPLEEAVVGAVSGLTLLVGLGLLFLGVQWFWIVFVVGFAGALPAALGLARYYRERGAGDAGRATGTGAGRHRAGRDVGSATPDRAAGRNDATSRAGDAAGEAEALETLRERYARGEIDEVEFERRVERLLGTESVSDAREYVGGATAGGAGAAEPDDASAGTGDGATESEDGTAERDDASAGSDDGATESDGAEAESPAAEAESDVDGDRSGAPDAVEEGEPARDADVERE